MRLKHLGNLASMARIWRAALVAAAGSALMLLGAAPASASSHDCPNADFRTGASALLPDCRAYEMVSPPDKGNGGVGNQSFRTGFRTGAAGEGIIYGANGVFAGAEARADVVAYFGHRGGDGWGSSWIGWPSAEVPWLIGPSTPRPLMLSEDGRKTVYVNDVDPATGEEIAESAFLIDLVSGEVTRMTPDPRITTGSSYGAVVGGNADLSSVILSTNFTYTDPGESLGSNTSKVYHYDADTEELSFASWSPDGDPIDAADLASDHGVDAPVKNYVSEDGQVYYMTVGGGSNRPLYRGEVGVQESVDVMRSEVDPTETGEGKFQGADTGGERVFFLSIDDLVPEGNASFAAPDLYMYDHTEPEGDRLTLISEDQNGNTNGAAVAKTLGNSDDGRVVYFVAGNQILPGEDEDPGNKLYRWEDGEGVEFIDRVTSTEDIGDRTLVTPDGRYATFTSHHDIGGAPTGGFEQAFLYDHADGELECASCRPSGDPNEADAMLGPPSTNTISLNPDPRQFLSDGRVIFNSEDRLFGRVTNGESDVYTYEEGELELISTGRSASPSFFADASDDGSSIFFTTRERLVAADEDIYNDLYVARVDGGFAYEQEQTDDPCEGSDCQGEAPPAPDAPAPGSERAGHGNAEEDDAVRPRIAVGDLRSRGARGAIGARTNTGGRLTLRGPHVRPFARRAAEAGAYRMRVALKPRARRVLARRGTARVAVGVGLRSREGVASQVVGVTFRVRGGSR